MHCKEETSTYVEFFYVDTNQNQVSCFSEEVETRQNKDLKIPKYVFAFRYYDQIVVTTSTGKKLFGDRKQVSGLYYINGVVLSKNQVKTYFKGLNLENQMNMDSVDKLVITLDCIAHPFFEHDRVWYHISQ